MPYRNLNLNILAVDDDPKSLEMLEVFLEAEGHKVRKAADGQKALEMINESKPDMVITDAMMPRLNGFELCRRIKEGRHTSLLPVIIVTALDQKEDRIKGINAGCDDFFSKPFDRLELQARVKTLGRLKRSNDDLERTEEVLKTLANSVEARDGTTGDHCQRLIEMGTDFADYLGLDQRDIDTIAKAGILHDIGKIAVPDAVLLKPGRLNDQEWAFIKTHPVEGERLLKPLRTMQNVLPIVRHHHERFDGSGYPDGLAGVEIPYLARVFQFVDIYDALSSSRPYKEAMSDAETLALMQKETRDGLRDPELMKAFAAFITPVEYSSYVL
jgi:putative two-component system response regulator